MNRFIIILFFFFLTNCSLDTKSGIWTNDKQIEPEITNDVKKLFGQEEALESEVNPNLKIIIRAKPTVNSFVNNLTNNNGRIKYNGNLKNISKFKFSKIKDFDQFDANIIFEKENIIFFNKDGSILKYNASKKQVWKINNYTKREKKQNPLLLLTRNKNTLFVADNIGKYYALDIITGKLLWSKNNSSPFNSQIKTYKDKFFVIDFENVLRSYSIIDGSEVWKVKTETSFIKSQKKLSFIILDNKIFFNNSVGDLTAINIENGDLLWQISPQQKLVYQEAFFLKTSDLIGVKNNLLFSNEDNNFYSIDSATGTLNWKQKINSSLRSTVTDDIIFTFTMEGFLVLTDLETGIIIRANDIFKIYSDRKRKNIKPRGFIVGLENVYLTTSNGRLIVIKIETGQVQSVLKVDRGKISRPFIHNKKLYILKDNSIIKLN